MPLELIVGAAVGAAVVSPKARSVVRRGLTYGLAGLLIGYDKVTAFSHGVMKGARQAVADAKATAEEEATVAHASAHAASPGAAPTPAASH